MKEGDLLWLCRGNSQKKSKKDHVPFCPSLDVCLSVYQNISQTSEHILMKFEENNYLMYISN